MKRKNKVTYLIFIVMILLLGLGYALLTTNLNITGTTVLKDNRWDIHFENVQVTSGSVTATTPAIDQAGTTVSYGVTLDKPGDFYEFTVDAVNDGSIDGMIDSISSKLNGTEITTLPNALEYSVTYADGVAITNNQILEADDSESIRIRVGYKTDIEISDLPSTEQTLNLLFTITYVQADDTAQPVRDIRTVYTVNLLNSSDAGNTVVWIGQSIPAAMIQYTTPQAAIDAALATFGNNHRFYLKHTVVNDIVTESYLEFVITPEVANSELGTTAGTYALRGTGATYNNQTNSYNNDSVYYETNKSILQAAFGSSRCNEVVLSTYTYYNCRIAGVLAADTSTDGTVSVYNSYDSYVYNDGSSFFFEA